MTKSNEMGALTLMIVPEGGFVVMVTSPVFDKPALRFASSKLIDCIDFIKDEMLESYEADEAAEPAPSESERVPVFYGWKGPTAGKTEIFEQMHPDLPIILEEVGYVGDCTPKRFVSGCVEGKLLWTHDRIAALGFFNDEHAARFVQSLRLRESRCYRSVPR